MTRIRIVLADDHTLFRRGLRLLLESQPDMAVVGEAADGQSCFQLIEQLRPDVVLMDVTMAGLDGVEATQYISSRFPGVHVVGLTMHRSERYFRALLEAGAVGYILKGADPEDLLAAIRGAAEGESYLDPTLARVLVSDVQRRRGASAAMDEALSEREEQVLRRIAAGQTGREIALELNISPYTVKRHRSNILAKLGLRNRTELIRYALRHGLADPGAVPPEEE